MDKESERPTKRFKHQSYQETLKSVHLPSAAAESRLDEEIPDSESHFSHALDHWRQLNLSPAFLRFANQAHGLSASVPLLLHHAEDIVRLWIAATEQADDDALRALLDLLQKLLHDLRGTLQPLYMQLLEALLAPLPRPQSAETFTSLLATLSLFFKHLLGSETQNIQATWSALVATIAKCNPEVQRAVSEVWATILRKAKGDMRKTVVTLVLHDVENISDSAAWMFVYAFKSVSHTLHTCTPALFEELLKVHLSTPYRSSATELLLTRTLTALIHHCDKAEQFSPISDILVSKFAEMSEEERPFIMHLIFTVCSVRRGSRMTQKHVSKVLTLLASKEMLTIESKHLLSLCTSALLAGEMPAWMGPGRRLIELSWDKPHFGLKLSAVLSEVNWGGWRLIELPYTLKHVVSMIESEPSLTLVILASLTQAQRFDDVDEGFLRRMSASIQKRLQSWKISDGNMQELTSILALSPILSSIAPELSRLALLALDSPLSEDITEVLQEKETIAANVFGVCTRTLADIPPKEWSSHVEIITWSNRAMKRWPNCLAVQSGLVALSRRYKENPRMPMSDVYPWLQDSILSHNHDARLSALQLLTSSLVEQTQSTEVLRRCLQGEEVTIDIQGVRERIVRITGVPQVVKDGDKVGATICARWLTAQLKINLRPLWLPTTKALAVLSQRFGDTVWNQVFTELDSALNGRLRQEYTLKNVVPDVESTMENERSWRDPSAAKLRATVEPWLEGFPALKDPFNTSCGRLDVGNYENQLLHALGEVPSLTQKHNADLVRLFLSFGSPDLPIKPARTRLTNWLTLFSKLDNPKAFHQTSILQKLHRSLLSHPDRNLQTVALTCLLNYKSPHLMPYEAHLRAYLDNARWKDEVTSFDLSTIEKEDRFEAVDVIIRLFFGLMLERRGRTKGVDKRASLLGALGGCSEEELKLLVDLMLEPFSMTSSSSEAPDNVQSAEKQYSGFLNLLGDVMKRMGSRLVSYWPPLFLTTIKLVAEAQAKLEVEPEVQEQPDVEGVEESQEVIADDEPSQPSSFGARSARSVRQLGIKRFTDFFRCDVPFNFHPYMSSAFAAFISPRVAIFDRENTQSPSALMELFHVWSLHRQFAMFLVAYDDRLLPKIYACLQAVSVKPVVVSRVFDIIEHVLAFSMGDTETADRVLKPHITALLDALSIELPNIGGSRSDLLHRQVSILSQVAQFTSDPSQAKRLLHHFSPLLKRPSKAIPEKSKVHLLKITQGIIPLVSDFQDQSSTVYVQTFDVFAKLFQTLRSKPARIALLDAFGQLSTIDTTLQRIHGLLLSLNAFSTKRMDEPDFNRRLEAFTELNEDLYSNLSPQEWRPILYNMLQFIQDPEELAIRTNAAYSFRRFIDILATEATEAKLEIESLFMHTLFPALKNGLLSKVELVRNEVLGVLAYGASKCDSIAVLSELRPLLANGDDEANFFNNIHHIQVHRRTRALRRLSEYVENSGVRSTTVAELFVPLITHYIVNAPDMDHILVDVTIVTTGIMARKLNWGAYNGLVRQYLALIKAKTSAERACVRALVAILENFHFPMDDLVAEDEPLNKEADDTVESVSENPPQVIDSEVAIKTKNTLTRKIADAVHARLLPTLLQHLEKRDDNEDALRIPVSVGIAQVACHLPKESKDVQISRLLTILCQVFRSKAQDTRALARDSLCKIAVIIGPTYLAQILTELRAALLQGPHLHILAYVAHALVVHVTSPNHMLSFNDLDACATDVAHVSAEVIFGRSGNDVRSEGFKTTILEVRASATKGLDSFGILAKHITPSRISAILNPIKGVMHETGAAKSMQLVDDVLRRISAGLNANERLKGPDYLALCHTLIEQNARFLKEAPRLISSKGKIKKLFAVQTKRHLDKDEDHYAHNSFKFVVLGLDLFNIAFRRGRFDLQDADVVSRLEAMVPVIGNTLYSQSAPVVIQGLKATASIARCPLKSLEKTLPVFVRQTLEIIKQAGTTESEAVQTAFRTLAVIIRDCSASQVKEKDLVFLLEVLTPDLEEPNRQAAVFSLLRAIVSRKFVVAEIYDIMDKVAEIMVTNQAAQVQELCRAVLLQFLLDYPQGKGRLRNQMTFLAQNLSYVFESGRKSVMEILSAIFVKFDKDLLREYADLYFVALVMVIANDDSSKCREMAAELIKLLLSHLDGEHRKVIISHLHTWSSEKAQLQLSRVSAQVYGLVVDTLQQDVIPYLRNILEDMKAIIQRSVTRVQELELLTTDDAAMDVDIEWQLPYHALNTINKLIRVQPELIKDGDGVDWSAIGSHLLFPHAWVRNMSSRLIGFLYNAVPPCQPNPNLPEHSLVSLSGLVGVARGSCLQLKSDTLDKTLSLQVVKNLFYIGKCFCYISTAKFTQEDDVEDGTGEEAEQEPENKLENIYKNPLPWLFSKLSYQARSAWLARRNTSTIQENWSEQPLAILRWFAAMTNHMNPEILETYLVHILNPVYRIVDDDTIRDSQMEGLKTLAQELIELVQSRVGTTKFVDVYNRIRQGVAAVRRERKNEKVIQTTTNPQAAARRKIQRNAAKKSNKIKATRGFAEGKVRNNRTKVHTYRKTGIDKSR